MLALSSDTSKPTKNSTDALLSCAPSGDGREHIPTKERPARSAYLYRQSQILAREGIEIGRAVLADWTGIGALEIVPVVRRQCKILFA